MNRPFSGDQANKNQNPKGSYVANQNKMIPNSKLIRPKTAKFDEKFNRKIELNYEKQTSVADPTHYEEDKHLSNIDETLSKKTDTDYELSSENSDDKNEKSIIKQYDGSPLMSHEKENSANKNSRFPELQGDRDVDNESSHVKLTKSISAHNILFESSNTNNLCQNSQSEHERINQNENTMRNNESGIEFDNFVESLLIPKSSQINLGSPVQQKDAKKKSTSKMSIIKRPSSAGNRFFQPNRQDDLSSNLLASTVHISRDKLNVNLGKTIFFKPEVESVKMNKGPVISNITSRVSSANLFTRRKDKGLVLVQKYIRGYLTRIRVVKLKEIKELLDQQDKSEDHLKHEAVGKGLKLSDLSIEPNSNQPVFKRTMHKQDKTIISNDMTQEFGDKSRFDNTQSILLELFKRDNNKNRKFETSKILDMDMSKRGNGTRFDERDLNDMNMLLQESPLKAYLPEDDITVISSRIETNRKNWHNNNTFDLIGSTRKVKRFKDESLRIVQTIKKAKASNSSIFRDNTDFKERNYEHEPIIELDEEYETKQQVKTNYKRDNQVKNPNWKSSLTHLKSSLRSERRHSKEFRRRDEENDEEPIKTHRQSENDRRLITEIKNQSKKRPSSAEVNSKICKLDVSKIRHHLKLLHKSIKNSKKCDSSEKDFQTEPPTPKDSRFPVEVKEMKLPLPSVPETPTAPIALKSIHRRHTPTISDSENVVGSPKRNSISYQPSPHVPKVRRQIPQPPTHDTFDNSRLSATNFNLFETEGLSNMPDRSFLKKMFQNQYKELGILEREVLEKGEKIKRKFKAEYKLKKISRHDYNRKIIGVEKWVNKNSRDIKKKKSNVNMNIMMICKTIKQHQEELNNLKSKISDPID